MKQLSSNLRLCAHLREPPPDCRCGYKGGIWSADGEYLICEMGVHKCLGSDMMPVANEQALKEYACLFAAAPEMLEALKALLDGPGVMEAVNRHRARAAIANAEGGLARKRALAE